MVPFLGDVDSLDDSGLRTRVAELFGARGEEILAAYAAELANAGPRSLFEAILTDVSTRVPSIRLAEAKVAGGRAPVYMFVMAWRSEAEEAAALGAYHAIGLPFFMDNVDVVPLLAEAPTTRALAARASRSWTAFARGGDPNHPDLPGWRAYTLERRTTMVFDDACRTEDDPRPSGRSAWKSLK